MLPTVLLQLSCNYLSKIQIISLLQNIALHLFAEFVKSNWYAAIFPKFPQCIFKQFFQGLAWQPPTLLFQHTAVFQRLHQTSNSLPIFGPHLILVHPNLLKTFFSHRSSSTTACKYIPLAAITSRDNCSHISTFN